MSTLLDAVERNGRDIPDGLAYAFVRDGSTVADKLTYAEFSTRARAVGAWLAERARPGDRALLIFKPGLEFLTAFYGCLFAGVVAVPSYLPRRDRSRQRTQAIIDDCAPLFALTTADQIDQLPELALAGGGGALPVLAIDGIPDAGAQQFRRFAGDDGHLAFLQYTSGSTSTPKGVMISRGNLDDNLRAISEGSSCPDRVMVSWLPTFHDMGLIFAALYPMRDAFPAYIMAPQEFAARPVTWLKALSQFRGTHSAAPNFAFELCVDKIRDEDLAGLDLSSVRNVLNAAEPIRHRTVTRFLERFGPVGWRPGAMHLAFGMAETTVKTTEVPMDRPPRFVTAQADALAQGRVVDLQAAAADGDARRIGCCGRPDRLLRLIVADPERRIPLAENEVGEIWCAGPSVALGYWNRPDATEATFRATLTGEPGVHWLRTGDMGFLRDGEIHVTGRLKETILLRGRNLYPYDIEQTVQDASPLLIRDRGAAFAVIEDEEERLVVVQELRRDERSTDRQALIGEILRAVAEMHEVEVEAVVLIRAGTLLLTSSGKIRRLSMRDAFLAGELAVLAEWRRPTVPKRAEAEKAGTGEAGTSPLTPPSLPPSQIRRTLADMVAGVLGLPSRQMRENEPLAQLGFGSMAAIQTAAAIEKLFGCAFDPTLFYRLSSISQVAEHIAGAVSPAAPRLSALAIQAARPLLEIAAAPAVEPASPPAGAPAAASHADDPAPDDARAVAVVGLACRLPGAADADALWRLLEEGRCAVAEPPPERPELAAAFADAPAAVPRRAGWLPSVAGFDPAFFRMSPAEADLLDPQHRLVLETAWRALEDAGQPPERWRGRNVGVFVGISTGDYMECLQRHGVAAPQLATGNAHSMAANRLNWLMDWRGPSLAVDTACSSSLSAIHLAVESLRRGESEMALAGGVNLILGTRLTQAFQQAGMLSPTGLCHSFDAAADGYVRGEGCGIVVLKRLSDARRDGDRVLAVVRGTAANQDGASNGLTAPNGDAQERVIAAALRDAGLEARAVGYLEAHGTGTPLGDPIEAAALAAVYGPGRDAPCPVGTIKANIGHLEAAAGVAAFIKLVLALRNRTVPPLAGFTAPNPLLAPHLGVLAIPTRPVEWPAAGGRRIAAVSSFGFGGANVHLILEEGAEEADLDAPAALPAAGRGRPVPLALSAHTAEALVRLAGETAAFLRRRPDLPAAAVAAERNLRRGHLSHRLAVVGRDGAELAAVLEARIDDLGSGGRAPRRAPRIAACFSGQAPDPASVRALADGFPAYREALAACARLLEPELDLPLDALFAAQAPRFAEPAAFAAGWGMAALRRACGLEPELVAGDGPGAYVAAVLAGVMDLETAVRLVALRGRRHESQEAATAFGAALDAAALRAPVLTFAGAGASAATPAFWHRQAADGRSGAARPALLGEPQDLLLDDNPDDGVPGAGGTDPVRAVLDDAARAYMLGATVEWAALQPDRGLQRVPGLPGQPFLRQRCWFAPEAAADAAPPSAPPSAAPVIPNPAGADAVVDRLRRLIGEQLRMPADSLDPHQRFTEMGADSIVLMGTVQRIEAMFGVKLSMKQLFDQTPDIASLAGLLAAQAPAAPPPVVPAPTPAAASHAGIPDGIPDGDLSAQIAAQAAQLESLAANHRRLAALVADNRSARAAGTRVARLPGAVAGPSVLPPWRADLANASLAAEDQRAHLGRLVARRDARTGTSKRMAAAFRPRLADNRASAGFRFSTKELVYPIVGDRAEGAMLWDVDGNAYVDITMGFGVNLFGHSPDFVREALNRQIAAGFPIGPQSPLAGEVAELVCRLTGLDRACFCNSGTEAVMTALRLARTVTGRSKVVLFEGSYHGHFDGVLASPRHGDGVIEPVPMAPGTPPRLVGDILPLSYGDETSLEIIAAEARNLAAILVEPVQSRRPDLQPRAFLERLREIATASGAVLIFDEMITGFRLAAGGAQEWFGIRADLATYGKIVGGGLPIGVVAGKAPIMDALDGGQWSFGDDSYPGTETTFFAGTFNKHPLAMAAARAVLTRIADDDGSLYRALNERTAALTDALNRVLTETETGIRVVRCGSLFRFVHHANQDVFIQNLIDKGVFIWEGRNCFLSAAHGEAEVERIVAAVRETVAGMARDGFFAPAAAAGGTAAREPLGAAQRQLLLYARLNPASWAAYNEPALLALGGPLDEEALRRAWRRVVARHEALRTRIDAEAGVQEVLPPDSVPDLPDIRRVADDEAMDEAVAAFIERPFDAAGPLFRLGLFTRPDGTGMLVECGHHALVDGWSLRLIAEDLGRSYRDTVQGREAPAEAAPSYRSWLARCAAPGRRAERQRNLDWWLDRLEGPLPVLDLKTDRPRPELSGFAPASVVETTLDAALSDGVVAAARALGATPYMVLLGAWLLWLHRASGQDRLIVGVPVAGRDDAADGEVVGYCAHMLPVPSRLEPSDTVAGFLTRLRGTLLDSYEHADVSFADLLERLRLPFDPGRAPVFSTTFNLDQASSPDGLFPVPASLAEPARRIAKFDLGLNVTQAPGEPLRLRLDRAAELFDECTARRILDQYGALLRGILADPSVRPGAIDLSGPAEREAWRAGWLPDAVPVGPATVPQRIAARAAAAPGREAVRCGGRSLTYGGLLTRADRLAGLLSARGIGPETAVGVALDPGPALPVALLAVWRAGGFYVPLDPDYPRGRLVACARDAACRMVLTSAAHAALWQAEGFATLVLSEDGIAEGAEDPASAPPPAPPSPAPLPQQLAYVIHTSGSTGVPKGVAVPHAALANFLEAMERRLAIGADDRLLSVTTPSFDIAGLELYAPLVAGGTVVIAEADDRRDPRRLAALLDRAEATVMQATPATWRLLLESGWTGRAGLRILCGGEALPADLAARLTGCGAALWNLYGPTETTIWSSARRIEQAGQPVDLGPVIDNTRFYVLDAALDPVPPGVPGELWIAGLGVARGYVGRPGLTAERFLPDPWSPEPGGRMYRTGDLVCWADGRLDCLGRLDHQVKVRGFRIELDEVRVALESLAGIAEAAVVAVPEAGGGLSLAAFLRGGGEALPSAADLRARLAERLPAYMVPQRFHPIAELPQTANGKLDRRRLVVLAQEAGRAAAEGGAPATDLERRIAAIWAEALGRDGVGIDVNFFDLGGSSLTLARMHGRVCAVVGRDFPLVDCLHHTTVRALARHLAAGTAGDGGAADPAAPSPAAPELDEADRRAALRRRMLSRAESNAAE